MKKTAFAIGQFLRKNFRSILGFAISGIFLWLTFHNSGLQLKEIKLEGNQWFYFTIAIFAFAISTWFQSIRAKLLWRDQARNGADIRTYSSIAIGNFYSCLLPGNLGDAIRAWHFSRKQNVPFSSSLASIAAEKWIDAQMFVVLTLVLFFLKPFADHYIFWAIGNTSMLVIFLSVVYALMLKYTYFETMIWTIVLNLRKPGRFLFRIYKYATWQLLSIRRNGLIPIYVLLCVVILFLNVAQFFLLLLASGIEGPVLSVYTAFFMAVGMMIIAVIPAAPGNIGVLHYGIYALLILAARRCGLTPGSAELHSYALLGIYVHLSYLIPEMLIGAVYVIKEWKVLLEAKVG